METQTDVDQIVFHYSIEGSILLKDSDDFRFQEEYWYKKTQWDNMLLNKINKAIKDAGNKVPRKSRRQILFIQIQAICSFIDLNLLCGNNR